MAKTEAELREELLRMQYQGRQQKFSGEQLKKFNTRFVDLTEERYRKQKEDEAAKSKEEVRRRVVEGLQPMFRKHGIR